MSVGACFCIGLRAAYSVLAVCSGWHDAENPSEETPGQAQEAQTDRGAKSGGRRVCSFGVSAHSVSRGSGVGAVSVAFRSAACGPLGQSVGLPFRDGRDWCGPVVFVEV